MTAKAFEFLHPLGVAVSSTLSESTFLSANSELATSKQDMHTGWAWYRLPPFKDGAVIVGMSLGFNHGILEFVTISDTHTRFGAGWSEWSETKEQQRAASIAAWLASKGYPVGQYSWGSVGAGYDSKGGFGSASIRYAAQQGAQRDGP